MISIMSIIARDFNDLNSFDQPLAAIKKMAATATRVRICDDPTATFVPSISINTSATFGACITKVTVCLLCWDMPPHYCSLNQPRDCLQDVSLSMKNSKLNLNADKTEFLIIDTSTQRAKLDVRVFIDTHL